MVREPESIDIQELELDDDTAHHLERHGISNDDVLDLWLNNPLYFWNLDGRAGTHVMIGEDSRGRVLYIPLLETAPGRWRPISGWESRLARKIYRRD